MIEVFAVAANEAEQRIDKVLSERFPEQSRQYFQSLMGNHVLVNGTFVKKRYLCREGDLVSVDFVLTDEIQLEAENIPLDILFEDDSIMAIHKPAGMVVHPGPGNWSGTLANALLYHCSALEKDDTLRPGIVHRLDKDTSGVLIAAKNSLAKAKMVELFSHRLVQKIYLAICLGKAPSTVCKKAIGRHPTRRKEMCPRPDGKEAETKIETLCHKDGVSLVLARPKTGRTHQIRVHLKALGCPILGDTTYGKTWKRRMQLHAYRIQFTHPISGQLMAIEAPIPPDMRQTLNDIEPTWETHI